MFKVDTDVADYCSCPTYLVRGGDGAGRGVTAAYWQVSPVSDGAADTVTELLTGTSQHQPG